MGLRQNWEYESIFNCQEFVGESLGQLLMELTDCMMEAAVQ